MRRRDRPDRDPRVGRGLFHDRRRRVRARQAHAPGRRLAAPSGRHRGAEAARIPVAVPRQVPADPEAPRRAPPRGLRRRDQGVRLPEALPGRAPGQGQPAARRRRGARRGERPAPVRARGRQQGRARAGPHDDASPRGVRDLQRVQGPRLHRARAARAPRRNADPPDLGDDPRGARGRRGRPRRRHPADDRVPRASPLGGRRQVAGLGRHPREVRVVDHRAARGHQLPAGDGSSELRHVPALPHRLAGERHPRDEGGGEGGDARSTAT